MKACGGKELKDVFSPRSSMTTLSPDLLSKETQILKTLAMPGRLPSLHFRSIFTVDGLQERGEPLEELLSNRFYSDKFLGASSCHASYLRARSSMKFPVKLKEKVVLSFEKPQDRTASSTDLRTMKLDQHFLTLTAFLW